MLIARGKYIAVLDADDAYKPERLERLLSEIRFSNDIFVSDLLTMCFDKQGILVPGEPLGCLSCEISRTRLLSV